MTKRKETMMSSKNEDVESLKAQLAQAKKDFEAADKDANEWKQKYYEVYADMQNVRRQVQRESDDYKKYAIKSTVEKLVPVFESFDMALRKEPDDPAIKKYAEGFSMIYKKLLMQLTQCGVTVISPKPGDQYDPNTMQAYSTVTKKTENEVDQVFTNGYMIYDHLIKPAGVIITKLSPAEEKRQHEKQMADRIAKEQEEKQNQLDQQAKLQAELEEKAKAEQLAKEKAATDAKAQADAQIKAQLDAQIKAQQEKAAKEKAKEDPAASSRRKLFEEAKAILDQANREKELNENQKVSPKNMKTHPVEEEFEDPFATDDELASYVEPEEQVEEEVEEQVQQPYEQLSEYQKQKLDEEAAEAERIKEQLRQVEIQKQAEAQAQREAEEKARLEAEAKAQQYASQQFEQPKQDYQQEGFTPQEEKAEVVEEPSVEELPEEIIEEAQQATVEKSTGFEKVAEESLEEEKSPQLDESSDEIELGSSHKNFQTPIITSLPEEKKKEDVVENAGTDIIDETNDNLLSADDELDETISILKTNKKFLKKEKKNKPKSNMFGL